MSEPFRDLYLSFTNTHDGTHILATKAEPRMIKRVTIRPNLIPRDLFGACTICLHEDSGIRRKTYRSHDDALLECDDLGATIWF